MKKEIKKKQQETHDFSLENFTGPLDLLLHLARTHEIEITEISLDELIEQYVHYIQKVHDQGLNIASTYLEMAAELIRLKSLSLLPGNNKDEMLDELEELGIDRDTLIKKLMEYKQYKEITINFESLIEKRHSYFTRPADKMRSYREQSFKNSLDVEDFNKATHSYLLTVKENEVEIKVIEKEEIKSEIFLKEFETSPTSFSFKNRLCGLSQGGRISLFLAILEGLKLQFISFEVNDKDLLITPFKKEHNE